MMTKKYLLPLLFLVFLTQSCSVNEQSNLDKKKPDYYWEQERENILSINDMVLIYGGNPKRDLTWDNDHFAPYVSYTDQSKKENWLFDGFLFLELSNGQNKIFGTGFYGMPANQKEWDDLLKYYFTDKTSVYALDDRVGEIAKKIGAPTDKRKVVIAMPEPIVPMRNNNYDLPNDYWGEIDGRKLDFSKDADRVLACQWYIDQARRYFNEGNFENLELAGFYWLAEETLHTKSILSDIALYLNEKKYSFNWIPYWKKTPDYYNWESLKFNYAYLQPNYFFDQAIPYSRLNEACKVAKEHNLDMELEFDLRVLAEKENWSSRLYDYMKAFRENGILETKRIAYYQDADALYVLSKSQSEANQKLYHDFCSFVVEHNQKMKK